MPNILNLAKKLGEKTLNPSSKTSPDTVNSRRDALRLYNFDLPSQR